MQDGGGRHSSDWLRRDRPTDARVEAESHTGAMERDLPLGELRRARLLMQHQLAAALCIIQAPIAKPERRNTGFP